MSKKGLKVLSGVLVILLAASVFLGVVTNGFKNWDVTTWFVTDGTKDNDKDKDNDGKVKDEDGNELKPGEIYAMPKAMSFMSPMSLEDEGITVTASLEPANTTQTAVTWSVYFVNTSSEWASGKTVTDYVTITADGLNCTVKCLDAFGEQIKVRVTSDVKTDIFAECSIDYVKQFKGFKLYNDAAFTQELIFDEETSFCTSTQIFFRWDSWQNSLEVYYKTVFGVGTKENTNTYSIRSKGIGVTDAYKNMYCAATGESESVFNFADTGFTITENKISYYWNFTDAYPFGRGWRENIDEIQTIVDNLNDAGLGFCVLNIISSNDIVQKFSFFGILRDWATLENITLDENEITFPIEDVPTMDVFNITKEITLTDESITEYLVAEDISCTIKGTNDFGTYGQIQIKVNHNIELSGDEFIVIKPVIIIDSLVGDTCKVFAYKSSTSSSEDYVFFSSWVDTGVTEIQLLEYETYLWEYGDSETINFYIYIANRTADKTTDLNFYIGQTFTIDSIKLAVEVQK